MEKIKRKERRQMKTAKEGQLTKILEEIRKENEKAIRRDAKLNFEMLRISEEKGFEMLENEIEAFRQAANALKDLRKEFAAEICAAWESLEEANIVLDVEREVKENGKKFGARELIHKL